MQSELGTLSAALAGYGHELENWAQHGNSAMGEILMDLHNNAVGRKAGRLGLPVDPADLLTRPPRNWSDYFE